MDFEPQDPNYEERVRDSFGKQRFMTTLGAVLRSVRPGSVEIALPFNDALTQQHGFMHAGAVTAVADSACGYAALSLMPPDAAVLTVEFKTNLLSPATGPELIATGSVTKPGRTLTVCQAEVTVETENGRKSVATMLSTMMAVLDRGLTN